MTPRTVGLLAALSAIWGGSYLLIKYALEDMSAPMVVWSRVVIGAIVLLGALRLTGGDDACGAWRATCAPGRGAPCCSAAWRWPRRSR